MAPSKLALAVIFIDLGKMYYSAGGKLLPIEYPAETFHDLEVVSSDVLKQKVKDFVTAQKLAPAQLIMIFANNLYFEKDLTEAVGAGTAAVDFAEAVPFDRVLSRAYPLKTGSKAIAMNRAVYEVFRDAFLDVGFHVHSGIPAYALGLLGVSKLDEVSARQVMKRSEECKQLSLVQISQLPRTLQEREEELAKKHTPLILVVFIAFLILVVGLTYFVLTQQQQAVRQTAPTPTLIPTAIPQPLPSPAIPSASPSGNASPSVTLSPSVKQ